MKKLILFVAVTLGLLGLYRVTSSDGSTQAVVGTDPMPTAPIEVDARAAALAVTEKLAEEPREPADAREAALPPAPATHGSLLVRVLWSDGEPAADVGVTFQISTPALPSHGIRRVVTDEDGLARAAGLPAGPIELKSDRGDRLESEVVAGEERELRLELADRLDVLGTVVDEQGRPVPGASIWLTTGRNDWLGGRVVARADESGEFVVRAMDPAQSLGALASGFAPSELVDLDTIDKSSPPAQVELRLVESGGDLRVRVTSAGAPLPGATVACGDASSWGQMRTSGGIAEVWSPRAKGCDAEGVARFAGLASGETPVSVRAEGFGTWRGAAVVPADGVGELEVDLPAAVSVTGVVRDELGELVQGAVIRVLDRPFDESFIQGGQYDHDCAFGYPSAVSNERGKYRIEAASPGSLHLYASPRTREWRSGSILHVHETLEAAPGEAVTWDVELVPGPTIAGRVTYSDGEPIPEVFVSTINEESQERQATTTTEDGRFVFYNVRPAAYTVSVQLWDAPEGEPPLVATHVWPSGADLVLVTTFPKPVEEVPGEVRLRFHDAAGRLAHPDALSMTLHSDKGWFRTHYETDGDQYVFGDLPPEKYRANVLSGEDVIYAGDWFELAPGELRDLGTLETEPGGSLEIQLARPEGTEQLEPRIWLKPASSAHGRWHEPSTASVLLAENLSPGTWELSMYGTGLASTWAEAEVRAGETATVRLELRRAVARELEIAYPDEVTLNVMHLQIHDEAGREVWDWADPQPTDHGRPYRRTLPLPLGRISVKVDTDAGLTGSLEFTMTSLAPDQAPVRVELR